MYGLVALIYTRDDEEYAALKQTLQEEVPGIVVERDPMDGESHYCFAYDIVVVAIEGARGMNDVVGWADRYPETQIIWITNDRDFAAVAIKKHIRDFIIWPYEPERFRQAVREAIAAGPRGPERQESDRAGFHPGRRRSASAPSIQRWRDSMGQKKVLAITFGLVLLAVVAVVLGFVLDSQAARQDAQQNTAAATSAVTSEGADSSAAPGTSNTAGQPGAVGSEQTAGGENQGTAPQTQTTAGGAQTPAAAADGGALDTPAVTIPDGTGENSAAGGQTGTAAQTRETGQGTQSTGNTAAGTGDQSKQNDTQSGQKSETGSRNTSTAETDQGDIELPEVP